MAATKPSQRDVALAGLRSVGVCACLVSEDNRIVTVQDGLGFLPPGDNDPIASIADLVGQINGARDASDALDLVLSQAREPDAERLDREHPVFALPPVPNDGSDLRWIEASAMLAPPALSEGRPGTVLLILRDVTEERQYVYGLERRLELMTRTLDRAPFGLAVLDEHGQIRDVNTAFRRMIGGRPASGRKFLELFHDSSKAGFSAMMKQLTEDRNGTPEPLDARLDGPEEKAVTVYASRANLADRDRPGILIHAIDATERKRLESQFVQSQKMQAVGQLAGGIAHDFNNVLTAIIGFCGLLLQRHHPGDPSFADVMQIQQNANRAAGLTRQLLAFSRQQTMQSRIIDVTDTLAELSNLLRRLLGESTELSMVHGRDLWPVLGDRGQLEQVVINLAVNARDAMSGGGRLIIQTDNFSADRPYQMREEVMPAGDYVMLTVSDNGAGMTAEVLSHIFEPFFTTKEVGQGTGLGLAMVYGSVSQMGGFVVAHSDGPGKGATFSLYLPRADESEREAADAADGAETRPAASDDTGGEHILLVEDEDAVRLFSARALRAKGYQVTEARTGEVVLELLADQSFDLLVTDMVMPKVDGATLIREARKAMPELPVICISGYTREAVANEVAELPKVSFLSKPFSLKQLSSRVRAALESRP